MPLSVTDLKPGDRVVLNCPAARSQQKREAVFQGIFNSSNELINDDANVMGRVLIQAGTEEYMKTPGLWARFLFQTAPAGVPNHFTTPGGDPLNLPPMPGPSELRGAFRVEPDGALREEEGKRITIERRIRMGQG